MRRAALAFAASIPLVFAPSVESSSGWWTLAQAQKYLAGRSPLNLVDMQQSDRPEFRVRFAVQDAKQLRPLGRARMVGDRRTWQRFAFAGRLFDVERAVPVRVKFELRAADRKLTQVHGPPPNGFQPRFPMRMTLYYEWFPEGWKQKGIYPFTNYHPSLGWYSSSDASVIRKHIAAMIYGRFAVAGYDWWGQNTSEDARFPLVLGLSRQTRLRWAVYYEAEGYGDPSVAQIHNDLVYLRDRYFGNPSYLQIGGRPVVFAYGDGRDTCGMTRRWKDANAGIGAYIVLKVFGGYRDCADQPDGWHQYGVDFSSGEDHQVGYAFMIMPGFFLAGDSAPRSARSLVRWTQNIRDMVLSNEPFQLVLTFNEWGEGTAIESAKEWATPSGYGAYLDALHKLP